MEGFIPGVPKNKTDKDIFKIFGEAFHNYEERIACKTIEENILTRRNDLCIEICSPLKVTSGIFSTFQYTIKTNPLEYNVIRKLSDSKEDNSILELTQLNRNETIKAFEEFKEKEDKIIY